MLPKIKHILYASDLSKNSIPALTWAMMLSHQHDARVTFLHVNEEVSPHAAYAVRSFMGEDKWKEMTESWKQDANSEIEERIRRFCDDVAGEFASCHVAAQDIVVTRGVPVESILGEAEKRSCDLIVMGTHGAGVLKDTMIGSTARRVIRRSKLPVVVIPLAAHES